MSGEVSLDVFISSAPAAQRRTYSSGGAMKIQQSGDLDSIILRRVLEVGGTEGLRVDRGKYMSKNIAAQLEIAGVGKRVVSEALASLVERNFVRKEVFGPERNTRGSSERRYVRFSLTDLGLVIAGAM